MLEKDVQKAILEYLNMRGLFCFTIKQMGQWDGGRNCFRRVPKSFIKGIPDIAVVLRGGRMFWVECKSAKGRLSPEQMSVHARLAYHGHMVIVARSVEQVHEYVEEHREIIRRAS